MTDLPAYLRPFVLGVLEGSDVRVDRLGEIDLYRPPGTARGGAILFVHGGPGPDNLEVMPRDWPVYKGYATAAARRGLVAAVVDHSLIHGLDRLVVAADEVEAAVGVLRSDPRVDPDRVGLWFFSGAGLLAGEWLDSRPDWLRFVALSYPLLATPPGVDDLVSAADVIGNNKDLPVLLTRAGLEREELAGPVAEFVSAGGAALDIIDVPKGHHGFDMLDHTEESRAAVTKALDWAIAHLGEEPGDDGKLLVPPPARKKTTTRRTTAVTKTAVAVKTAPAAPATPPAHAQPAIQPAIQAATQSAAQGVGQSAVQPATKPQPQAQQVDPAPAPARISAPAPAPVAAPLADLGAATVAAVTADTPAARVVAREHAASAAHDLEGFLAMYSPTARILLADGTELKGRRFLREYYRARFDAGQGKSDVVQKIMLGEWVVEQVVSYDDGESTPQLALYRVVDGLIVDVEFRV